MPKPLYCGSAPREADMFPFSVTSCRGSPALPRLRSDMARWPHVRSTIPLASREVDAVPFEPQASGEVDAVPFASGEVDAVPFASGEVDEVWLGVLRVEAEGGAPHRKLLDAPPQLRNQWAAHQWANSGRVQKASSGQLRGLGECGWARVGVVGVCGCREWLCGNARVRECVRE
eukprot:6349080-Prymnesium_polylepis.1